MNIKYLTSLIGTSGALLICQSQGATIASDSFSYADGSLIANGDWANHSGNDGDLLVANGAASVQHGAPSEDANLLFETQSAGILTATFDVTVLSDSGFDGGTDYEYFAHFMTRGSFNFRSRLDVQAPTAGGDYTLGISSSTSTAQATLTNDFNFGEAVSVELSFDFSDGVGSLTVNGETIVGEASGGDQSLDAIGFRQSDSTLNELIVVDNLVVDGQAAIPEPSTSLLGGLALLALARRRR